MACVLPPELDDRELLAYLDDEAGQQVVAHLKQCPHCRERADRWAQLQARMTAELFRITCPTTMELGEHHLGLLPGDQSAAVTRHLTECPHCSREVAQLRDYLEELAPELELSPMERIKVLVAQLVGEKEENGPPQVPSLALALTSVRGAEETPRLYQAGNAQIAIEIQDDAEQPDRKMLLGLVTGIELRELRVQLWLADQPLAWALVDELGNFVISNLEAASYELILSGPEVEVQIQDLHVGMS